MNFIKFEAYGMLTSQQSQHKVNESIQNLTDAANKFFLTNTLHCSRSLIQVTKEDMDACSSFNFVEVDKELLHLVTLALFAVFFFLESLPCAALCVQADVSALGKIDLCPVPLKLIWQVSPHPSL
jgi:hypothetical protein